MDPNEEQVRIEATQRIQARRGFWRHLGAYVIVNAALIGVWAATGAAYFWPGWILGGWGIGLAFHGWNVFVGKPIGEDEIKREMDRLRRKQGTGS